MTARLTADQAAQRLLALVDVLDEGGSTPQRTAGGTRKRRLAASSISWAFHESADTAGLLSWLVENIDARKNGLTAGELELLAHLDRIGYSDSADDAALAVVPGFELATQKAKNEARIARLDRHADTVRSQGAVLASRADHMSRELAALLNEEERLKSAARASDAEVARLVAAYRGLLDEAALAAKSLEARLSADAAGRSASSYFYQRAADVAALGPTTQHCLEEFGQRLGEQLVAADRLPSPWSEFGPFGIQSTSELLALATEEHTRINNSAAEAATAKLELDLACRLVRAIGEEAAKVRAQGCDSILRRCRAVAAAGGDFEEQLHAAVGENAARMAASVCERVGPAPLSPAIGQALVQLDASSTELAQARSAQVDRLLDAALGALEPHNRASAALADALADEHEMLGGWVQLWATVSASLDRDNATRETQCTALQRAGARSSSTQVISPDDRLALALKRLLAIGGPGAQDGSPEGAFTEWSALLDDAGAHRRRHGEACCAVDAAAMSAAAAARQLDGVRADLAAALHGGDTYAGTEALDVLPVDVRDALGELKYQASVLRRRVTKTAMLAEEPKKALDSDYAALFCQFY
ncbi:hypothetical protein H4R19_000345 [Coemansia spiralis]|nr:hypothetical protein H4R19_000345 [Coemansia spiralis]